MPSGRHNVISTGSPIIYHCSEGDDMERYVGKHQKEPGHQTRDTAPPVDNVKEP